MLHIEDIFSDMNLPKELTRLPFVESSFNLNAESKVGASGIWQIMPRTGRAYLKVTETIDERNSPLKASRAAAKILAGNFRSLKDWPLALTAYNHGPAGVKKALRISKTTNLPDLVDRYHQGSFRFASANFYTSFLAILHAYEYKSEIFGEAIPSPIKPEFQVFVLDKSLRFNQLTKRLGYAKDTLLEHNHDLKDAAKINARIPRGFKVYLPAQEKAATAPQT